MAKPKVEDPNTDRISKPADLAPSKPPSATKYSVGYKKDPHDPRDLKARALFGARRSLPEESLDLPDLVPGMKDQQNTSMCVGESISTAIDVRLRKMGIVGAPLASAQAIYTFARAIGRMSPSEGLKDEGCFPRNAMKGLKEWGVPSEARWPFDPNKVNDELPWDVMEEAAAHEIQAWWRIDTMGKERVEDICQALSMGYPVVFGTDVDTAFMDLSGKALAQAPDPKEIQGGHMMCLLGYRTNNSARELRGINSWGMSWADRGFYWASEGFITAPPAGDFYVLQIG